MKQLTPSFLETIPPQIEEGILYISMRFHTASHKCPCGCGSKIVTPLSPAGWTLIFDGKTVSLKPSIGNWSIPCKSHYWITNNCIEWATKWSSERINRGIKRDVRAIEEYYETVNINKDNAVDGIELDKEKTTGKKKKKKDGPKKSKKKSK